MYCRQKIKTFDDISVRFHKRDFDHAFFESKMSKDDTFSTIRAEKMDWIKAALQDPNSERYVGWNKRRKRHDPRRRVTVVMGDYVVVIGLSKKGAGNFITAYVADSGRTLRMIRGSSKWE